MTTLRPFHNAARGFFLFITLCAGTLFAGTTNAQVNTAITYQGELLDAGAPVNDQYDFVFELFDAPTGGNSQGLETPVDVDVINGVFTVELDFSAFPFNGDDLWLEISARESAGGGSFVLLEPRQRLAPVPYALHAEGVAMGVVGAPQVDVSQVQLRVVGSCNPGESIRAIDAGGGVICEVDDDSGGPPAWQLGGNSGTNASTDFLGTTDMEPLELRVNGGHAFSVAPDPAGISPVVRGGTNLNVIFGRGAVIGGGGALIGSDPDVSGEGPNIVYDIYGTIGGGFANQAGENDGDALLSEAATVGGGASNFASGPFSTVSGGQENRARFLHATIGGGVDNRSDHFATTVAGGASNDALGETSTIGGGQANVATGRLATITGGNINNATASISAVGGGQANDATGFAATVAGGQFNIASGSNSTVGGGDSNLASAQYTAVPGGRDNEAGGTYSMAAGRRALVRDFLAAGEDDGQGNPTCNAGFDCGDEGTFVWSDASSTSFESTGPNQFLVRAQGGVGINENEPLAALHIVNDDRAIRDDQISGEDMLVEDEDSVLGLYSSRAGSLGSTLVLGETNGTGTSDKWSIGRRVGPQSRLEFRHGGSVNYGGNDFIAVLDPQIGLAIHRSSPSHPVHVGTNATNGNGAHVTNGGTWTNGSSRAFKTGFSRIDPESILERVISLPVSRWQYRNSTEGEHLGPVAEDFAEAFNLGNDSRYISTVDADGVALAAIQALAARNADLQTRVDRLAVERIVWWVLLAGLGIVVAVRRIVLTHCSACAAHAECRSSQSGRVAFSVKWPNALGRQ